MTWQEELGNQIKIRRMALGLSQQQLAETIGVKRQTIDNIEKGSAAAAVNKITEISKVLDQPFVVLGCRIGRESQNPPTGALSVVPLQLCLEFDCEYFFASSSLKLTRTNGDDVEMHAIFSKRQSA